MSEMSFDNPAVAAFILCFYGRLYSPVFATLYQEPEGESEQDPRQRAFPSNSTSRYHLIWRSR